MILISQALSNTSITARIVISLPWNGIRFVHTTCIISPKLNGSDVLHQSLVYTGARNGSITRFDLRVPPDKLNGQWLFRSKTESGATRTTTPSSVLYLKLVKDSQLLVSQMNGEVSICQRFLRPLVLTEIKLRSSACMTRGFPWKALLQGPSMDT